MKTRINQYIRAAEVRLIDSDGKMIGILKTSEALRMAQDRQVDLVEISPNANPPVAKLLDFDKYRYQQEKLAQQSKKKVKKVTIKGIRLTVRIGTHDLDFKAKQTNEFLAEGHKCKVDVVMRGREQAHLDLAFELIKKFLVMVTTPFVTESGPTRMGHTVSVIIGPSIKN